MEGSISMYYCEGKNCSRRDQCAYHECFEWKYPRQCLDMSTQGSGSEGIDENGNRFSYHRFYCGDNAWYYGCYKAFGYREGQEYKNSKGFCYDEACVNCEYLSLCFMLLEDAGLITKPAERIAVYCENIKANPEKHKEKLIQRGWREEIVCELK